VHSITLWHICVTTVSIKVQQCVFFTVVEVQNMMYCLHVLSCHDSKIPCCLKISIIWRFNITVNRIVEAYSMLCEVWTEYMYTSGQCQQFSEWQIKEYLVKHNSCNYIRLWVKVGYMFWPCKRPSSGHLLENNQSSLKHMKCLCT
jgi:hypothetical protein